MQKKVVTVLAITVFVLMTLIGCGTPTCRYKDCEETEIYEDGYCKYHYYIVSGDEMLKDIVNGTGK